MRLGALKPCFNPRETFAADRSKAIISSFPYLYVLFIVLCVFHVLHFLNIHVPPFGLCVCWASLVAYVVSLARSSIHSFIDVYQRCTWFGAWLDAE